MISYCFAKSHKEWFKINATKAEIYIQTFSPRYGLVKITSGDITRVKRDFVLCLHEVGGLTGQIRNRILKIDAPEAETC